MIKLTRQTDTEMDFEYTDSDERNEHVNKLLHEGWTLTRLAGTEIMIAEFKKEVE